MSDQFVGEIRIVGFNFPPTGWAYCMGQLMPLSQNTALFSLLGTYYGGNGQSTFALPDLQGKGPVHFGAGAGLSERFLGESGGVSEVTLLTTEMPAHTHQSYAVADQATVSAATGNQFAASKTPIYSNTGIAPMGSVAGGGLPHNNMPPYLVLNFIIALQGVFPSHS